MALSTRVTPIRQDIQPLLDELLSPRQRSLALAEFARTEIVDARVTNRQILGREPPFKVFVDGNEGAALETVRPDGVIVVDFQLVNELLLWIGTQLEANSPFETGRYKRSHALFADGQQVSWETGVPQEAEEYVFINLVPYARKIERGFSSEAPDGVYQVVATLARRQFRDFASITFAYRTAIGGGIVGGRLGNRSEQRNPAIIVRRK
jgi:hypothetical protein